MARKWKLKGCKHLGAELRRLRGKRTLLDIAEASRTPPLCHRVRPISASTLSQLESGQTVPSLDSLYALSTIHGVVPQRLYSLLTKQLLESCDDFPDTLDGTHTALVAAFTAGDHDLAHRLSLHGEGLAEETADVLAWRTRTATCMTKIGMAAEAIPILLDCLRAPELSQPMRFMARRNLASVYRNVNLEAASDQVVHALREEAEAPEPATQAALLRTQASLLIEQVEQDRLGKAALGEALRILDRAETFTSEHTEPALLIRIVRTTALHRQGNRLVARREYTALAKEAADRGHERAQASALMKLGLMHVESDALKAAEFALRSAERLALTLNHPDTLLTLYVALHELAVKRGDSADQERYFLKRCGRYFPRATEGSHATRDYMRLVAAAAG